MWMKAFMHMSCQSIRMFETIFSSSKTMPAYLQFCKELFASWPRHTLWPASQVSIHIWSTTPWIIWTGGYMIVSLPSRHISQIGTLASGTIGNAFYKGWGGYNPRLLFSMRQMLKEYIFKSGSHTRYELQYINLLSYYVHVCNYFQQRRINGVAFFLLAWEY